MERFERFNNAYRLIVATAVSAAAALLLDDLQRLFSNRSLAWALLVGLVAIFLFLLNSLCETAIENSLVLRKWIMRGDFIEGHWFDITIDRAKMAVHHGCFMTIRWERGQFVVNGVEFNSHGDRICTVHSTSSLFANRVLTFAYESHSETFNQAIEMGIDQLQFDNPPQSYSGFYFDFTKTVDFRVHGTRIEGAVAREYNGFRDVQAKRRFIVEQIELAWQKMIADQVTAGAQGIAETIPPSRQNVSGGEFRPPSA